jgi:GT2 family glycosyltransferase
LPSAAAGDAVLVLNPDVRLDPGCGAALLDVLGEPGVGIAVPVQRDRDGSLHPTLRREPTVLRALGEAVLGGWRAGRVPVLGEMVTDHDAYAARTRADWATGSVMAVSKACLASVGEWDETFFLYSEETDFALRARERGFQLRLAPGARCEHVRGASHDNPQLWALLTVNRLRLFATRHGALRTLAFRAALLLGEGLRSCGGALTHRRALVALLRGDRAAVALVGELSAGSGAAPTSALVA